MQSACSHSQSIKRCTLPCASWRELPRGRRRARSGVLHPGDVERRSPPALVVLRELDVVALAGASGDDVTNAGPGRKPRVKVAERGTVTFNSATPSAAISGRRREVGSLAALWSGRRFGDRTTARAPAGSARQGSSQRPLVWLSKRSWRWSARGGQRIDTTQTLREHPTDAAQALGGCRTWRRTPRFVFKERSALSERTFLNVER